MIEVVIYISLAVVLGAMVRVYKAKKSGLYYNIKRDPENIHPKLEKYNKNIHFISSPSNYLQMGMVFALVFTICRLLAPELNAQHLVSSVFASYLIAWGQSTLASYWWQIWINRGSGLPDIDPNENYKSEFAWGKISFWFSSSQLFNSKKSIALPFIGALQVIIGILVMVFFLS